MSIKKKIFELRNEIGAVEKDSENPFYKSKYFDINKLIEKLHPILKDKKLLLTQPIKNDKVCSIIEDLESGESEESSLTLPDISDPQKIGSAITYYRRYTLKSLLAIQEEDDDGNTASKSNKASKNGASDDKEWLNKTEYKSDELTDQWKKVLKRLKNNPDDIEKVYSHYKVNTENRKELDAYVESIRKDSLEKEIEDEDLPF